MGELIRRLVVPAVVGALLLGTAACGGDPKSDTNDAPKSSAKEGEDAPPKEVVTQRWPRYWATIDSAEAGARDALSTAYFAGYDDTSVVYTGQDVIRFLDRTTGKQRKQVVLKNNRLVCTSQPRRQMENGVVLIGTGVDGVDDCNALEAYDTATGKLLWTYGSNGEGRDGKGAEMTVDQRDGVVLFSMTPGAGDEGPGLLVGLDAATGRQLWRKQAPDYFFGRPAKRDDDCFVNPALAADRPVVIAFLGCSPEFPDEKPPAVYGLDLKTGEQLWTSAYWERPEYVSNSDSLQVRPHTDDGRTFLQTRVSAPVRVDSETGEVTTLKEPAPRKIDGQTFWWPICDDFRAIDYGGAGERMDDCAFTNGDVEVFARGFVPAKNVVEMRLVAADAETGKTLWTWGQREVNKPKKYEFHYFEFIGFNADRSEFWVLKDQKDVIRLDVETGERVGQGLAAPPMELLNFAVAGPKFVLTRTVGGITGAEGAAVRSGLNFYATDAE